MLASATKLLTTIATLQVVERGLFALDDDVTGKLPELGRQKIMKGFDAEDKPILAERKNPITLRCVVHYCPFVLREQVCVSHGRRNLLTHSSGAVYPEMDSNLVKLRAQRGGPPTGGLVSDHFDSPLLAEPGEGWMYGVGIDWAGLLVERLTNTSLEDWMQKHIRQPLGLSTITFWPDKHEGLKERIPQLTMRNPEGALEAYNGPTINDGLTGCFGGHGAYASMSDYSKVLQSLLANDGKLLQPSTRDQMFQPQLNAVERQGLMDFMASPYGASVIGEWKAGLDLSWGLGGVLLMQDDEGRRKKGTLSWGGMTNPFWMIDPQADLALAWGTQVLPPGDKGVKEMISAVEFDLYKRAGVKF